MKNKTAILTAFLLIGILALNLVMADINVYGFSSATGQNETTMSLYITLQDTGITDTGKIALNNVTVLITHNLNYTFANNITVISCLLKEQQISNNYNADGTLANSSTIVNIVPYNYSATSLRFYQLKDRDILQLDLLCFYDADIDDTIFQYISEAIIGLGVNTDSYTCGKCSRGDYEQTISDYMEAQQTTNSQLTTYGKITGITDSVTEFWLIIYWVLRIFIFLILVGLVFALGFYLYNFFKRMGRT